MDEWYFDEKEIKQVILEKQGKYKIDFKAIIMPIIVSLLMLFYGIYVDNNFFILASINLIFIIIYFVFFCSKVFENIEIIKKLKKCIMQVILFFLISLFMNLIYNLLLLIKIPLKSFTLKGITYSPENILILIEIFSWWTTFIVSMFTSIEIEVASLFLLITYAICKVFQELTILVSFSNQSKYVKWIFKKDMHKIEMFFIQLLLLVKSLSIVFSFINISNLSNSLISIVLINGIYGVYNYIINNFSNNSVKTYLVNVIKELEYILSKLEQCKSDDIKIKITIKPYYLYCNNTKNKKINNALESINNLCFTEEVGRSKKIYENKELLKKEILNTLDIICKTNL